MDELYSAPAFVINLDRRTDRWEHSKKAIEDAGFRDVRRFQGIDAENPLELKEAWDGCVGADAHINTYYDTEFQTYKGKQGILLSQVLLWKHIIDCEIARACIFEDDVVFHSKWKELAPAYYAKTPKDWDVLFMGSQMEFESRSHIDRGPVFCLHAYCVTLNGARKLYDLVMNSRTREAGGIYTIDTMLKVHMETRAPQFDWYVWNGSFFPDEARDNASGGSGWTKRNQGLVFQDVRFGSDVRAY